MFDIENIKNKIICGDCNLIIDQFPNNLIDLTITSPPYDTLRSYQGYKLNILKLIKDLYRITKPGGIVVWVVGDAVVDGGETGTSFKHALCFQKAGFKIHDTMIYEKNGSSFPARRDGSRYSQIFEYMFVFSKGKPKCSKLICDKKNRWQGWTPWGGGTMRTKDGNLVKRDMKPVPEFSPRNNIWKYNTGKGYTTKDDFAFKHPAMFPEQLVEDHIKTWSNIGDIILDPLCGAGTTLKVAKKLERNFVGIEISEEYCAIAQRRISTSA